MTDEQRNTLNAACGDLAAQILWHGFKLSKDDWRHMLAGTMLGWRMMPGINLGEGPSFIMLGGSSLSLTKSQAADAITQAFAIGDDPSSQGLKCSPVRWCKAVCMARWIEQDEAAWLRQIVRDLERAGKIKDDGKEPYPWIRYQVTATAREGDEDGREEIPGRLARGAGEDLQLGDCPHAARQATGCCARGENIGSTCERESDGAGTKPACYVASVGCRR